MVDSLEGAKLQYRYAAPGRYTGQPSLITQPKLCEECNRNQATKIQELNSFEPLREHDFDSELDAHKHQLNERYKLCHMCHDVVKQHLSVQAMDLKTFLLGSHLQQTKSTPTKLVRRSSLPVSSSVVLAQLACVLLASLLLYSDSLSSDHSTCDKSFTLWYTSVVLNHAFWSNFTSLADITTVTKHLTRSSFREIASSFWETSLDFICCLSSFFERRYLHVSLVCLLINIVMFLKRKNRFAILILFSWTMLSALRCWELFWLKSDSGWRVTVATFCWVLCTCSFLFSLLLYSRVLGTRKKKSSRSLLTPSQPSAVEKHQISDTELMDTSIEESEPSHDKTEVELDHNLNGLTLGLPVKRHRNGYSTLHSSRFNSGATGSFWNQRVDSILKETPLVSMRQRPLIVPATLHFSGLQVASIPNHKPGTRNGYRPVTDSFTISDDEVSLSDTVDDENSIQNSRLHKDKGTKPDKASRKIKRQTPPKSSKTRITGFINAKTFLFIASILLNMYFIVLFTEWPVRILHSLWRTFKK